MDIFRQHQNSGLCWVFEYMEENLRARGHGILGSSETLIIQLLLLGRGRTSNLSSSTTRL